MKRKSPLLMVFGTVVTLVVFGIFAMMTWSAIKGNAGKPLTTLEPQGPFAQDIQGLVIPVFAIAGIVFIGVMGVVLFIAFRFRDRGDEETADEIPKQLHGKTWAELTWTIIPAVVLLVIGIATVTTLATLNAPAEANALHVRVEGQQWWWKFSYDNSNGGQGNGSYTDPEDVATADELVIPVGTEIELSETSNDVIHSFWIPALNGKKDAVPGMTTDWKLQADGPGVYRGQCTEFCGLSHGNMRMLVRAVPANEFAVWMKNQQLPAKTPAAGSLAAAGETQFKGLLCASCHLIRGVNDAQVADPDKGVKTQLVSGVAPDLTHFATRGTFAGSIFNSHYPNPTDGPTTNQPFGQTCTVKGLKGSADILGNRPDEKDLPACPEANQFDAFDTPFASAPGNPSNPPDAIALSDWLRDPPKMKPMAPLPEENPYAGGRRRGMPNLKLTEEQINQLVAYLNSLS